MGGEAGEEGAQGCWRFCQGSGLHLLYQGPGNGCAFTECGYRGADVELVMGEGIGRSESLCWTYVSLQRERDRS